MQSQCHEETKLKGMLRAVPKTNLEIHVVDL